MGFVMTSYIYLLWMWRFVPTNNLITLTILGKRGRKFSSCEVLYPILIVMWVLFQPPFRLKGTNHPSWTLSHMLLLKPQVSLWLKKNLTLVWKLKSFSKSKSSHVNRLTGLRKRFTVLCAKTGIDCDFLSSTTELLTIEHQTRLVS